MLVFFNNGSVRMFLGVCNRYILAVFSIPCMLNILGSFAHNTKISLIIWQYCLNDDSNSANGMLTGQNRPNSHQRFFFFLELGTVPVAMVCAEGGVLKYKLFSNDFPYKFLLADRERRIR